MAYVGTPIDTTNQFQSLQGKRFNGDGSTTDFTLDVAPSSTLDIEVFVENVRQDPNSAYTLSGTTLSFTGAPPSGTNNIYVVHQAKAVGTIEVLDGAITTAKLGADAVTEAKIADDAVESEHLNDNIISGQTALATKPDATDEFLVSDAGTIKRIDCSLLSQVSVADEFRLTTNFTDNATPISSNLERIDAAGQGTITGSQMSNSSGVFTFPSTGIYYVGFDAMVAVTGSGNEESDGNAQIHVTTDNSTYHSRTGAKFSLHYNNVARECSVHCSTLVDVTDTSNVKVRFHITAVTSQVTTRGNSDSNQTCMTFIRLGDT